MSINRDEARNSLNEAGENRRIRKVHGRAAPKARIFGVPAAGTAGDICLRILRIRLPLLAAGWLMLAATGCSAPGPVLPPISQKVYREPGLFEVQPFQERFKDNLAAYFQILDNGSAELWQLSLDRSGRIRLLQFQGTVFEASPGPFQLRLKKCFIHGQDLPSSDRVPLEVFQCDHLALGFRRSPTCSQCLESTPLPDQTVDNAPSRFLHGLQLKPLKANEYSGKKINAFSNATEAWYWGAVFNDRRVKEGSYPAGKVAAVVDGFIMLEGNSAPERIVLPLPVSEGLGL